MRSGFAAVILSALGFAAAAAAQVQGDLPAPAVGTERGPLIDAGPRPPPIPKVAEPRTWELYRHSCGSPLGERELTLFLDGTIRLRVRDREGQEVRLGELAADPLARIYGNLRANQLSIGREEKEWLRSSRDRGVAGEFLQECEVELHLPDLDEKTFLFSPMEITPLWLGQLRQLAEDLAERTEPLVRAGLPKDYQPRFGDLLRRRDGVIFRFVGMTSDKKAWMVEQVGQPVTTYYAVEDLPELFIAVVESRAGSSGT